MSQRLVRLDAVSEELTTAAENFQAQVLHAGSQRKELSEGDCSPSFLIPDTDQLNANRVSISPFVRPLVF